MNRLVATVQSHDDTFKRQVAAMLRDAQPPVGVVDDKAGAEVSPDLVIVDGRTGLPTAMGIVERLRAGSPTVTIFLITQAHSSELILQSMHAGANEVVTWPPGEHGFEEGLRRMAQRRRASSGASNEAKVLTFMGAKGGMGTTTLAVNSGVELAGKKKKTVVVDLKPGLGDAALFLGVNSRYTVLDAIDNAHRLDESLLDGLMAKHLSGLELLPGSDQCQRPTGVEGEVIDRLLSLLSQRCEYIVVDAGSQINSMTMAALNVSDMVAVVMNPDVPSIRNARRLTEFLADRGLGADRVRTLLNRVGASSPMEFKEMEEALGSKIFLTIPSDYKSVASALNAGVPLSFGSNDEIARQFGRLIGSILDPSSATAEAKPARKATFRFPRFASAR